VLLDQTKFSTMPFNGHKVCGTLPVSGSAHQELQHLQQHQVLKQHVLIPPFQTHITNSTLRSYCSVKEHAIRLAGAFQAPLVIMHTRGHIVPPLANPHLAALRAFLTSIRDEGCPESYR
jgi:predicted alpha/beta hydrolase family esterase